MRTNIFWLLLLITSTQVFAQDDFPDDKDIVNNGFWDNWYISAGYGANVYYGTMDSKMDFGDRMATAFDVSLGKWFHPNYGVRMQYAGSKAKGYSYWNSEFTSSGQYSDGHYDQEFNFMNIHADFLFNISNIIGGYKRTRFWQIKPYVGGGYARSWEGNSENPRLNFTTGIENSFFISDKFDINLEIRDMIVSRNFDGEWDNHNVETMGSVTVGLTYRLGRQRRKSFQNVGQVKAAVASEYTSQIDGLNKQLEMEVAENDSLSEILEALSLKLASKPKVQDTGYYREELAGTKLLSVFFQIGQSTLSDETIVNLSQVAKFINSTNVPINITAFGDLETGSKKRNEELSELRSKAVYEELINHYNVKAELLHVVNVDIENQPYDKSVLNRVAILQLK